MTNTRPQRQLGLFSFRLNNTCFFPQLNATYGNRTSIYGSSQISHMVELWVIEILCPQVVCEGLWSSEAAKQNFVTALFQKCISIFLQLEMFLPVVLIFVGSDSYSELIGEGWLQNEYLQLISKACVCQHMSGICWNWGNGKLWITAPPSCISYSLFCQNRWSQRQKHLDRCSSLALDFYCICEIPLLL